MENMNIIAVMHDKYTIYSNIPHKEDIMIMLSKQFGPPMGHTAKPSWRDFVIENDMQGYTMGCSLSSGCQVFYYSDGYLAKELEITKSLQV